MEQFFNIICIEISHGFHFVIYLSGAEKTLLVKFNFSHMCLISYVCTL